MNTFNRLLRGAAAVLMGLSLMSGLTFGLTGAVSAATGSDYVDAHFIDSWSATRDNAIIIHTLGRDYRAELQPGCFGLDFSIGVRFIPSGHFNNQFDRFGHVLLSDGTRCYLKSLTEVPRVKR